MTDGPAAIATTDALGNYTVNLPAGTYALLTQNTHGIHQRDLQQHSLFGRVRHQHDRAGCRHEQPHHRDRFRPRSGRPDYRQGDRGRTGRRRLPASSSTSWIGTASSGSRRAVTDASGNYISEGGTADRERVCVHDEHARVPERGVQQPPLPGCDVDAVGDRDPRHAGGRREQHQLHPRPRGQHHRHRQRPRAAHLWRMSRSTHHGLDGKLGRRDRDGRDG